MPKIRATGCGTGVSRVATLLASAALLVLGVEAAAGHTGEKALVRTYDIRMVGSVTTTAPDIVFTEKATHTYRGVRIRITQSAGRVTVGLVETRLAADKPNGAMSGEVAYQQAGPTPCSRSKQFRGPARLDVFGSSGRAFYAGGDWAGQRGGASLDWKECPGLLNVAGDNLWLHEKGRVSAQLSARWAFFGWLLPIRTSGPLPFPLSLISARRSFTATAAGSMNDGFGIRDGSLRVTFTARA